MIQRFSGSMFLRETRADEEVEGPAGTLLYLHGLGESGLSFEGLLTAPELAAFRHLAPDLPGYGKSPWPAEANGLEELADAVGRWLPSETSEPVVAVGHSMGGVLALLLAERFPGLLRAIVNVEGNVCGDDCTFSSRIAAYPPAVLEERGLASLLDGIYRDGLDDAPLRTYFASMSLAHPPTLHRSAAELVEISDREEIAGRLADLDLPQIYLLGNPRGTGARSRSLLTAAGIPWRAIPDAGHWPFLDQPDLFLAFFGTALSDLLAAG